MTETIRGRYVGTRQAAHYLGLSVFSVYRLVERRAIPFVPLYPSGSSRKASHRPSVRFDLEALDLWMRKQTVRPATEYAEGRVLAAQSIDEASANE